MQKDKLHFPYAKKVKHEKFNQSKMSQIMELYVSKQTQFNCSIETLKKNIRNLLGNDHPSY